MNVLITGGSGYIGSVLTESLLNSGFSVTVYDNLYYQQASLFHVCHYSGFRFVHGDVRDFDKLGAEIKKADVILPLAAIVGAPACQNNAIDAWAINFASIKKMIDIIGDQMIIYPTTNSGYGTSDGTEYCTEETPLKPISIYGQSKVNAEQALLEYGNAVTLRLATVFGMSPRMRLDLLVNDFTWQAVNNGYIDIFEKHFKRNYVHIRDVADCFQFCIDNYSRMVGEPYNLGLDSANLSKEELALKIKAQIPAFEIRFNEFGEDPDKRNYIVSSLKLVDEGFIASRSIEEGIAELVKGFFIIKARRNEFANI